MRHQTASKMNICTVKKKMHQKNPQQSSISKCFLFGIARPQANSIPHSLEAPEAKSQRPEEASSFGSSPLSRHKNIMLGTEQKLKQSPRQDLVSVDHMTTLYQKAVISQPTFTVFPGYPLSLTVPVLIDLTVSKGSILKEGCPASQGHENQEGAMLQQDSPNRHQSHWQWSSSSQLPFISHFL